MALNDTWGTTATYYLLYSILCAAAVTACVQRQSSFGLVRRFSAPTTIYMCTFISSHKYHRASGTSVHRGRCCLLLIVVAVVVYFFAVTLATFGYVVFFHCYFPPFHSIQVWICRLLLLMVAFFLAQFSAKKTAFMTCTLRIASVQQCLLFFLSNRQNYERTSQKKVHFSKVKPNRMNKQQTNKILNNNDTLHWCITNSI